MGLLLPKKNINSINLSMKPKAFEKAVFYISDPKLVEDFGQTFIQTWKTTHNYRVWASQTHSGFDDIQKG